MPTSSNTSTHCDISGDRDSLEPDSDSVFTATVSESAPSSSRFAAHSLPRLPIEVCERIIDFVSVLSIYKVQFWSRQSALEACCLTCRDWFPRSRLRLYQDVQLQKSHSYRNNIFRFIQCLKHSPDNFNGRLVQRIEVSSTLLSNSVENSGISLVANQFPLLLPNLKSFIIESINLINIHPTFYTSLSRFTSVRYLKLSNTTYSTYDQLFRFIAGFRNLTSLDVVSLRNLVGSSSRGRRSGRKLAIPHLLLIMSSRGAVFPDMMNWFSPCAESLDVSVRTGGEKEVLKKEIRAISDFIQHCGDSLRHLRFTCRVSGYNYHSIGNSLDFAHSTALRSLELIHIPTAGHSDDLGRAAEEVRSLAHALTTVPSTCLEDLAVLLYHNGPETRITEIDPVAWEHLDSAFALPVFDKLRHIRVGIKLRRSRFYSGDKMARLLPRLASRPTFILCGSEIYARSPFYELPFEFSL